MTGTVLRCVDNDRRGGGRLRDRFWERVGNQLRHPSGISGAVTGSLMAVLNARPYLFAIDALDLAPSDTVLEMGFGPGQGLLALAARTPHGHVAGVDHSVRMLRRAERRNRAAILAGRMELVEGTFDALPWPDAAFDKVLLVNAVYFFDSAGRDMSEVRRVLRPGGRLVVYATDRASMRTWPFSRPETHTTFDAGDLAGLLRRAGFDRAPIRIDAVSLPLGINGLVAVAVKA